MNGVAHTPPGYNTPIPSSIMTPDAVDTRIGRLEFTDGIPTVETTERVWDHGPLEPWFDQTWRPGDVTLIED